MFDKDAMRQSDDCGEGCCMLCCRYRVGPLDKPTYAELIVNSQRRNPVPFSLRPLGGADFSNVYSFVLPMVDEKVSVGLFH